MNNPLRPYKPRPDRPWDRAAASHLLRRAGFAPAEHEVQSALKAGPEATVERLIAGSDESARAIELDDAGHLLAQRSEIGALCGWWLLRLVHTDRPLHARMALFWHDHFATSNDKVNNPDLMLKQLRTFEEHALGRFEPLLGAIARDPAMVIWLDGNENIKGRPNENFARELFELFMLGVGNYTESDIKEAARAFTGWHERRGRFHFRSRSHDTGRKTVLGRSGELDGDDVIAAALAQPACARFLAFKLLDEFLCPQPPGELVEALAERLRSTEFDLAQTMRTLLLSEAMFDPRWYRARIKSPVELVVGMARQLEMVVPATAIEQATAQAGQRLFEPPSVKGWDGHRDWLNSTTMLVRLNAATVATEPGPPSVDPKALRSRYRVRKTEQVARFCVDLTLDGRAPSGLIDLLASLEGAANEVLRHALRLVLTSPEYQLA